MSRRRVRLAPLALIVALLLAGFALRARHITALPLYQDETYHLRRAQAVYRFDANPVAYAHGKLLLYYWIGLFRPAYTEAGLATARLGVALAGLLAAAGSAALARALFGGRSGEWAGALAVGLLAFAPYALFYDRLALSDTLAAALSALAGWWTVVTVRRPTPWRGIALGGLLALALLAKLSTAPLLALPPLAGLLLGDGASPRDRWMRLRPALAPAAAIALAVAALYALGALENALAGRPQEPYDPELFELTRGVDGFAENLRLAWAAFAVFLSPALALALLALAGVAAARRRRPALYLLAWLAILTLPFIAFAVTLQTRYFVPVLPVLAALFGGGAIALGGARRGAALGALLLAIWMIVFALPFARTLLDNPASLRLTAIDRRNFLRYSSNAWGAREALADLAAQGERLDGRVPLVGAMHYCTLPDLYVTAAFDWRCMDARVSFLPQTRMPDSVYAWPALIEAVQRRPFTYLLTDYLPPGSDPADDALAWDLVAAYPRPQGDLWVTVWRVHLIDADALAERVAGSD